MPSAIKFVRGVFKTFPALKRNKTVGKIASKLVVDKLTEGVPARPNPYSQDRDYASWPGLVDRRITGRHLPPRRGQFPLPARGELLDAWVQKPGAFEPSLRSNMLFAAFAQWFTDSFLRTSHGFSFDAETGDPVLGEDRKPMRGADRHIFNTSNHEIDLCQIYGLSEAQTSMLRVRDPKHEERGFLAYEIRPPADEPATGSADHNRVHMYPRRLLTEKVPSGVRLNLHENFHGLHDEGLLRIIFDGVDEAGDRSTELFAVGLEHGNSTIGNSLMNTLFLREHNRIAALIGGEYPEWDDEQVFQTTRNVMIVILLRIVIADYIAHIAPGQLPLDVVPGYADEKPWYRTNRIAIEFNLLYRWHELVPPEISFLPAADFRHNNRPMIDKGVEWVIAGLAGERAGKIVFGNLAPWLRGVLEDTLGLMRASNLATYSDYCDYFGEKRPKRMTDLTRDPALIALLERWYGSVDQVEWYVGLYAEDHVEDGLMGSLMLKMVGYDAFTQALTNPLLSKQVYTEQTFTKIGMAQIEATKTLESLIRRNVADPHITASFNWKAAV